MFVVKNFEIILSILCIVIGSSWPQSLLVYNSLLTLCACAGGLR